MVCLQADKALFHLLFYAPGAEVATDDNPITALVHRSLILRSPDQTALGRQDAGRAFALQSLAEQLLTQAIAVGRGRIDEGDAEFQASVDGLDRKRFIALSPAVPSPDRPGSQGKRGDFDIGISQFHRTLLHASSKVRFALATTKSASSPAWGFTSKERMFDLPSAK